MNLTDDIILKFQKGTPVLLDDICAVYPATMGEIIDEGYTNFQQYLGILTASKPDALPNSDPEMKKLLSELSDFQYILLMANLDPQVHKVLKRGFKFFTHEDAIFSMEPAQIIIGPIDEKHLMVESNFYDF